MINAENGCRPKKLNKGLEKVPLYEFICDDRDSPNHKEPMRLFLTMEKYEHIKDKLICPVTKSKMRRLWMGNNLGLKFKGPGFYVNDK